MFDKANAESKRAEVMKAISPICDAFGIRNYDYIITEKTERLKISDVEIGCASNSVSAVIDEVIGFLFVAIYCKNRYIGAFRTQTLNQVRRYWKTAKEETPCQD